MCLFKSTQLLFAFLVLVTHLELVEGQAFRNVKVYSRFNQRKHRTLNFRGNFPILALRRGGKFAFEGEINAGVERQCMNPPANNGPATIRSLFNVGNGASFEQVSSSPMEKRSWNNLWKRQQGWTPPTFLLHPCYHNGQPLGGGLPVVPNKPHAFGWNLKVRRKGNRAQFTWDLPVNAPLGLYKVEIQHRCISGKTVSSFLPVYLAVLFNPWNANDSTYIPDEASRQEYVLSENGYIWTGRGKTNKARPWAYGQFNHVSLLIALRAIDHLPMGDRASPVIISRALAAYVNDKEDGGVLEGRWSSVRGGYQGGRHPEAWVGSNAILRSHWRTGRPVKFGQCWVFAGVVTSLSRSIGLPCRPVTGYDAAHEDVKPYISKIIQFYSLRPGSRIPSEHSDMGRGSIWNYHVWNEVYMRRPDLQTGMDGWQVIDSTPQELSGTKHRMGPAPVKALRARTMKGCCDIPFLHSEVDADATYWLRGGPRPRNAAKRVAHPKHPGFFLYRHSTSKVGSKMLTRVPGKKAPMDITRAYKVPGSFKKRSIGESEADEMLNLGTMSYRVTNGNTPVGQSVRFTVVVKNNGKKTVKDRVSFAVSVIDYRGKNVAQIHTGTRKLTIKPKKFVRVKVNVPVNVYSKYLNNQHSLKGVFYGENSEGNFWFRTHRQDLKLPDLRIKLPRLVANSRTSYNLTIDNPFKHLNLHHPVVRCSTEASEQSWKIDGVLKANHRVVVGLLGKFDNFRHQVILGCTLSTEEIHGIFGSATTTIDIEHQNYFLEADSVASPRGDDLGVIDFVHYEQLQN